MRIFIIPSWYPAPAQPNAGIFFKEQASLYAQFFPEDKIGIVSWGQNDVRLLLEKRQFIRIPEKIIKAGGIKSKEITHSKNFMEWFHPELTWTRKWRRGNITSITDACDRAFIKFSNQFGRPQIIHAHVGYPGGYIAWKLSEKYDIPFVITEHMGPFPFPDFSDKKKVSRLLIDPLKQSHLVLAVSDHLRLELEKFGISSVVYHNFINDQFFNVKKVTSKSEAFRLLHIGRLAPEKRQNDLLNALALLPDSIDYKLTVAGDGTLKTELLKLAVDLGLDDRITFKGNLDRDQIREQIQTNDLMILSSSYENLPVSILEAFACGKPVVATKCGGPEEMINEVNGLLAKAFDPMDLAKQVNQMINELKRYEAPVIRKDFEERYGRQNALERLRKIYLEVLERYHSQ